MRMFFFPRMMKPKFSFPVSVTDKIKSCMEFLPRHSLIFTLFKLFVWMYKLELWANVASHEVQLNCSPPLHCDSVHVRWGDLALFWKLCCILCKEKVSGYYDTPCVPSSHLCLRNLFHILHICKLAFLWQHLSLQQWLQYQFLNLLLDIDITQRD